MSDYLYTGAWQLCDREGEGCFGMVAAIVQSSGETHVRLYFDVIKTHIADNGNEFVIDLPEAWAMIMADKLTEVLILGGHLYRLYRQGRLASQSIYSSPDSPEPVPEPIEAVRVSLTPNTRKQEMKNELRTEALILSHPEMTYLGEVSAFGAFENRGVVRIRLCKAAILEISPAHDSLDINVSKSIATDLALYVRQAAIELKHLRSLKKYERLLE